MKFIKMPNIKSGRFVGRITNWISVARIIGRKSGRIPNIQPSDILNLISRLIPDFKKMHAGFWVHP